jgi:hypothetical protein
VSVANVLEKDISAHPISTHFTSSSSENQLPAFVSSQQSKSYGIFKHLKALSSDSTLHLIASAECMIELFDSPKECLDLLKPLYISSSKLVVAPAISSSASRVKYVLDRSAGTCQLDLDTAVLVFKLLTRSRKIKHFAATNAANGAIVAEAVVAFSRECSRVFQFVDKSYFGQ